MKKILLMSALLLTSNTAFAFGAAGHETVCEIAYQELTDSAKLAVDNLVTQETNSRYQSFRDACVWADSRTDVTNARRQEHYINLPRNWYYIRYERCATSTPCLFTAIRQDESILRSSSSTDSDKWIALKFIGHWFGDLHQPLHVSYVDDRGGNQILLGSDIGCSKNLHAVWDTCIPEYLMSDLGFDPANTDEREGFGKELQAEITDMQRSQWYDGMALTDWAEESFAIAREPDVDYCYLVENVCQYTQDDIELIDHGDDENMRTIDLASAYEGKFSDDISLRLKRAGVRLGALLNDIFQ